ncbi:MAG: acetyltransferase [Saprospiraceae bacterium]|nr:acetyltransferase [Saprospiraceae bacterium]
MSGNTSKKDVILIGSSGHALVVYEILRSQDRRPIAFMAPAHQRHEGLDLPYWGSERESDANQKLKKYDYFVAIGDNKIRAEVSQYLFERVNQPAVQAFAPSAYISPNAAIEAGVLVGTGAILHPGSSVGTGSILNTGCVVDHDCQIMNFVHIGPGAVLCGNVTIGEGTFIGAGSTLIPGIKIGQWATIGAGSIVINDIPDGTVVAGNPAKPIR